MKFYISARDNLTLLLKDTGIEKDFEQFTCVKKFNSLGTWMLQLRQESSHVATFQRDGSGNWKTGIIVQMDNEDGQGLHTVFTGVQTDVAVKRKQDMTRVVTIIGEDDKHWLKYRRALQEPGYPYIGNWANQLNTKRFYALKEASGTVATDSSPGASNGTYNGTVAYSQPGLVDDPSPCVKFDGSTTFVSVPTAGLNAGNNAWTIYSWGMISAYPGGGFTTMWGLGTNAAKQEMVLGIAQTTGFPILGGNGLTQITGATAVPLNTPFLLAATYDGTTLTGYFFASTLLNGGGAFGSNNPGGLSLTFGAAAIGAKAGGGSNFWSGFAGMTGQTNSALTLAQLQTMFQNGVSRQTFASYDFYAPNMAGTPVAQTASSQLIFYMQRNASSVASPNASFGACAPTTAFTNWQRTTSARQIPNLSISADPLVGSSIYAVARQDVLLDLFGALGLQSSPEIGFDLAQVGSNLVFSVFQPTDRTGKAVFTVDRQNVSEYEWHDNIGQGNHVIAGGANTQGGSTNLLDRLFGEGEDATSISQTWYREDFLDYRPASNGLTLQQAITGQLAQDARQININVVTQQGAQPYYKGPGDAGFDLGDKVTVIADGQTFQQIVREVQIDLANNQPPLITPAIGTPISATIINERQTLYDRLKKLGVAISTLKTNY